MVILRRSLHTNVAIALALFTAINSISLSTPAAADESPGLAAPPLLIEAEDFVAASDTTPKNLGRTPFEAPADVGEGATGFYVGWTEAGEWLEYNVDVEQAGSYVVTLAVASAFRGDFAVHLEVDGVDVTGTIVYESTGRGWLQFDEIAALAGEIATGPHRLRLVIETRKINVDWLRLEVGVAPDPTPVTTDYPGQPEAGDVLWGAGYTPIAGMGVVGRYEQSAAASLELHRTFFQWHQRNRWMLDVVADDLANGRLPWVSVKTPPWRDVASGAHDDEIDQMLLGLESFGEPVWLTIHHEPEGGAGVNRPDDVGGAAAHLAMNQRVRDRITALGIQNVALALVLMGWSWDDRSGRTPDEWWAPGVYDFLGVDLYDRTGQSLLTPVWSEIRAWAQERDVDVAVGEWGIAGSGPTTADHIHDWYDAAVGSADDGGGAQVVALAVFDSPVRWQHLSGDALKAFVDILSREP